MALESERQRRLTDALTMFGWRWVAFRPARTERGWRTALSGNAGWPDIAAAHPQHGLLFMEVKRDGGKATPEQVMWLEVLEWSGETAMLVDSDEAEVEAMRLISGGRVTAS